MHMADALLSPAVGGAMWVVAGGGITYCAGKIRDDMADSRIPLMGVLAAFVFAAQMINFTIPGTGSSGHLGGGLLLAIILGPHAGFLAMASVLTVQALFFADGGLLALGCNIFNLGFIPCFVVYPYIYQLIIGQTPSRKKMTTAIIVSAVIALQIGALGVVTETVFSGVSSLPFNSFVLLMQPIHLAIGLVEGMVTAGVVSFIVKADPSIILAADRRDDQQQSETSIGKKILLPLLAVAVITAGIFSWFASSNPDGLEWSIYKVTGSEEVEAPEQGIHHSLEKLQEKTALLPDYGFKNDEAAVVPGPENGSGSTVAIGTSVAGLLGGALVLLLMVLLGFILKIKRHSRTE
ncbi:MAG: energy-coupling factor ABC transporter permease [Proteobacteria bacterium]|nr:energy-coupling factor ABC transporter permease [Pseudomonadota bacterium]MBU1715331.1 energy-coupling factor ABC transporter permease [Pseudomonadota bacterium]